MSRPYNQFGTCRICGCRILWIKTKSLKNMPVNPELINYIALEGGKERIVTQAGEVLAGIRASPEEADGFGYISHFATCTGR